MRARATSGGLLVIALCLLVGCPKAPPAAKTQGTPQTGTDTPAATENPTETPATPLRVFATDSLNAALPALASRYRATHDGKELSVTFGQPDDLATRVAMNKACDLFISDRETAIRTLHKGGFVKDATYFLGAQLVVITNAEHPLLVSVAADLRKNEIKKIAIAAPETAAGAAAMDFLGAETLLNVLQPKLLQVGTLAEVIKAVGEGQAELGFAFASSVRGKPLVRTTMSCGLDNPPVYIVAPIAGSTNEADAAAFVTILQDADSKAALTQAGFLEIAPHPMF